MLRICQQLFLYPIGGLLLSKNVYVLINSLQNGNKLLPFVQRVDVDHGFPSDVVCFDFVAQLLSLLQNPSIVRIESLAIEINHPLRPYFKLSSKILGEAISGSVYYKAYYQ
jgi:hypothetical protein